MFLKFVFVSFILLPCAFALKCVTGLTGSPPTVADSNLISVECPPSFEFCERMSWMSDAGKKNKKGPYKPNLLLSSLWQK